MLSVIMVGKVGTVSCVFVTLSSPDSAVRARAVSHLHATCFPRIQPTLQTSSVCAEARERSLRGGAPSLLVQRSLPQTWPTNPYTAPRPPSREASREGGT